MNKFALFGFLAVFSLVLVGTVSAVNYNLSDYPNMFIMDGRFSGTIVIGQNAPADDVVGAVDIAASLSLYLNLSSPSSTFWLTIGQSVNRTVDGINYYNISVINATGSNLTATGCNISITHDMVETIAEIPISSTKTIDNMNITVLDAHFVVGGQNICELGIGRSTGHQVINTGSAKLDSEIANIHAQNLISIGNPCNNSVTRQIMGLSEKECLCGAGHGLIKLYTNGSWYGLVVTGGNSHDTRAAARVLANYGNYHLDGYEVDVTYTDLSAINTSLNLSESPLHVCTPEEGIAVNLSEELRQKVENVSRNLLLKDTSSGSNFCIVIPTEEKRYAYYAYKIATVATVVDANGTALTITSPPYTSVTEVNVDDCSYNSDKYDFVIGYLSYDKFLNLYNNLNFGYFKNGTFKNDKMHENDYYLWPSKFLKSPATLVCNGEFSAKYCNAASKYLTPLEMVLSGLTCCSCYPGTSASIGLSDVIIPAKDRNSSASTTFTMTNSGYTELKSINMTINADTRYNATISQDIISSLAASSSATIAIKAYIPINEDSGKKRIGTLTVMSDKVNKTVDIYLDVPSKLGFADITVKGNDLNDDYKKIQDSNNPHISPIRPLDFIELKIEVKNIFDENTEAEDVKIKDIETDVEIRDMGEDGGDLDFTADGFDLKPGKTKRVRFNFTVPYFMEHNKEHAIAIKAKGEDENGATHTAEWTGVFRIERKKHLVIAEEASISQSRGIDINLVNIGQEDENRVVLKLTNDELNITKQYNLSMSNDPDEDSNIKIVYEQLPLPQDMSAGNYSVKMQLFYDMNRKISESNLLVAVEKEEIKAPILTEAPETTEAIDTEPTQTVFFHSTPKSNIPNYSLLAIWGMILSVFLVILKLVLS